jgi:hypothetical protein
MPFRGLTDIPIYFELTELPAERYKHYNTPGIIYVYNPFISNADNNGILSYEVIGAVMKKSDKRIMFIVNDLNNNQIYIELKALNAIMCGNVYDKTFDNYQQTSINSEYKGERNTTWIKLDHNKYLHLFGMVFTSSQFKNII